MCTPCFLTPTPLFLTPCTKSIDGLPKNMCWYWSIFKLDQRVLQLKRQLQNSGLAPGSVQVSFGDPILIKHVRLRNVPPVFGSWLDNYTWIKLAFLLSHDFEYLIIQHTRFFRTHRTVFYIKKCLKVYQIWFWDTRRISNEAWFGWKCVAADRSPTDIVPLKVLNFDSKGPHKRSALASPAGRFSDHLLISPYPLIFLSHTLLSCLVLSCSVLSSPVLSCPHWEKKACFTFFKVLI